MLFLGQKRKLIKIKNNYVLLRFDSLGVCKWHYGLLRFERLGVNTDYYKMVTVGFKVILGASVRAYACPGLTIP